MIEKYLKVFCFIAVNFADFPHDSFESFNLLVVQAL